MQMASLNIKLEKYQATHIFYHGRLHNVITHKPDLVWFLQYDNFSGLYLRDYSSSNSYLVISYTILKIIY